MGILKYLLTTLLLQWLDRDAVCVCSMFFHAASIKKTEISPGEKEDLELLERALEKAFCVRTGTGHPVKGPKKPSVTPKDPRTAAAPPKDVRQTSVAPSGKKVNRMTYKSGRLDRKEQEKTGLSTLTSVSRFSDDRMFSCLPT